MVRYVVHKVIQELIEHFKCCRGRLRVRVRKAKKYVTCLRQSDVSMCYKYDIASRIIIYYYYFMFF
ncbi:hypothetical protein HanRHA438_Chr01g0024041 [Helianthus annuus]|nr:hypothetical protein HanRHA438_Chr01g0024041 [Helianthus annuus]